MDEMVTTYGGQRSQAPGTDGAGEAPHYFPYRPKEKELGRLGEEQAVKYLERHGYELLERNWTCKFGEADIIACDQDGTVALVEVKTRYSRPGRADAMPELAVDEEKFDIYRKMAAFYYSIHPGLEAIRVDVVAVNLAGPRVGHIHHIANALTWDE